MPQSAAARVATAARRARCVELAGNGKTYEQIAAEVGFANKSSARKAVVAALAAREADAVDDLRRLEVCRLDQLQASSWEAALAGDARAIDRVLRIITLRSKLLGILEPQSSGSAAQGARLVTGAYGADALTKHQAAPANPCGLPHSSTPDTRIRVSSVSVSH